MYRIYVAEDHRGSGKIISSYLEKQGWNTCVFRGIDNIKNAAYDKPHMWIFSMEISNIEGYKIVCEVKRENMSVPAIFISSSESGLDGITALELGFDDYIGRPFSLKEIYIRASRLLESIYDEDDFIEFGRVRAKGPPDANGCYRKQHI